MKKYILIFTSVFAFALTSCDDQLELGPYNSITTGQAFNTPADFTNAMNGTYNAFLGGSYYGGDAIIVPDLLADNLIISQRGRLTNRNFSEYLYSGEATSGLFSNAYTVILRANAIIENIEKLPAGAAKDNFKAEALAIRALAHFDLVKMYGRSYIGAAAGDLGMPYVTSTDASLKPARETLKATYDKILADLIESEKTIATSNGKGRIGKATVQGILARLYLYRGEYQLAADAATRALAINSAIGTIAEFPAMFKDGTENGVLFKVLVVDKDAISIGVNYSQTGATGVRSEYVADYDLYTKYKATDVRKNVYFVTSLFSGSNQNHIAKYFGRATGAANVTDPKVLRTAEVLLTRAEALAELGKDADALTDLNVLRKNRYSDFDATKLTETGAALKASIELERRLELAFEGHRFFDLKRKNLPIVRNTTFGDLADGKGVTYVKPGLAINDPKFNLPIPQSEINANKAMLQNPGY